MGILNTQEQADALCTVIALGFIVSSKGTLPKQSYIIYQEDPDDTKEAERHHQLAAKLMHLTERADSKEPFAFQTQLASDKTKQPIILAQTGRSALQGDFADKEREIFKRLECKVNEFASIPLRGAYVDGMLAIGSAELLDPSILYWYKPDYRTFPPDEPEGDTERRIEKSYNNAFESSTVRGTSAALSARSAADGFTSARGDWRSS